MGCRSRTAEPPPHSSRAKQQCLGTNGITLQELSTFSIFFYSCPGPSVQLYTLQYACDLEDILSALFLSCRYYDISGHSRCTLSSSQNKLQNLLCRTNVPQQHYSSEHSIIEIITVLFLPCTQAQVQEKIHIEEGEVEVVAKKRDRLQNYDQGLLLLLLLQLPLLVLHKCNTLPAMNLISRQGGGWSINPTILDSTK